MLNPILTLLPPAFNPFAPFNPFSPNPPVDPAANASDTPPSSPVLITTIALIAGGILFALLCAFILSAVIRSRKAKRAKAEEDMLFIGGSNGTGDRDLTGAMGYQQPQEQQQMRRTSYYSTSPYEGPASSNMDASMMMALGSVAPSPLVPQPSSVDHPYWDQSHLSENKALPPAHPSSSPLDASMFMDLGEASQPQPHPELTVAAAGIPLSRMYSTSHKQNSNGSSWRLSSSGEHRGEFDLGRQGSNASSQNLVSAGSIAPVFAVSSKEAEGFLNRMDSSSSASAAMYFRVGCFI